MQQTKAGRLALAGGLVFGATMLLGSAAWAEPTPEMLSNTCAGCHGTNWVSAGPAMPTIAGMPAAHIEAMMQQFKKGKTEAGSRPETIMGRIAKGYSDEEIKAIAGFYAKQKWGNAVSLPNSKMATPVDEKLVAQGKKLQEKCSKCHADNGKSQDDDVPRMAGQWVDYLMMKMNEYKDDKVKVIQPEKMAKEMAARSADELKALAHYYASQK